MPWSAPAAPRASTPASSSSHWPSRRSTSRRNTSTRSARTPSARPVRSRAARPSIAETRVVRSSSGPAVASDEQVFESMTATYQPPTPTQAPTRKCGQLFSRESDVPNPGHQRRPASGPRARPPCPASAWGRTTPDPPPQRPARGSQRPPDHRARQLHGARTTPTPVLGKQLGAQLTGTQFPGPAHSQQMGHPTAHVRTWDLTHPQGVATAPGKCIGPEPATRSCRERGLHRGSPEARGTAELGAGGATPPSHSPNTSAPFRAYKSGRRPQVRACIGVSEAEPGSVKPWRASRVS